MHYLEDEIFEDWNDTFINESSNDSFSSDFIEARRLQGLVPMSRSFDLSIAFEARKGGKYDQDGGIFEEGALQEIADLEVAIRELPGFKAFCLKSREPSLCTHGFSFANYAAPLVTKDASGVSDEINFNAKGTALPRNLAFSLAQNEGVERMVFPDDWQGPDAADECKALRSLYRFKMFVAWGSSSKTALAQDIAGALALSAILAAFAGIGVIPAGLIELVQPCLDCRRVFLAFCGCCSRSSKPQAGAGTPGEKDALVTEIGKSS